MASPVKYKKPRRINPVSVTLAAGLALVIYLGYQYVPLLILKSEVYRILEETGSAFAGRRGRYRKDPKARESLRLKMESDLRRAGVDDPDAEIWIEIDGDETRFGVVYSKWVQWPFDVIETQEEQYEIEHLVVLK